MSYTGRRGRKLFKSFPKRNRWVCVKRNEKGRRKKEGDRVDILSTSGVGGIRKKKVWLEWGRGTRVEPRQVRYTFSQNSCASDFSQDALRICGIQKC